MAGAFFPGARLWRVNQIGFLPDWTLPLFPALAAGVAIVAVWGMQRIGWTLSARAFTVGTAGFLLVALAAFVQFSVRSHFLGDGYTLLDLMSLYKPIIKWRNFGGTVVPYGLYQLIEDGDRLAVLYAYRGVAWFGGALLVGLAAWGAYRLYEKPADRLLFFFGFSSGGHLLLFFGCVENYALFVVLVAAYCLVGTLIVEQQLSRWWLLLVQALVIIFHVFGAVLLPATAFVLLSNGLVGPFVYKLSARARWAGVAVAISVALVAVFIY